ncbi:MAG: hypothetical protein ABSC31_01790 [Acidimicrobiales bacterium]|jgi:hypothetical protein
MTTRRPKANEVYWENPPALARYRSTWAEEYPDLASGLVTVEETRYGPVVGSHRVEIPKDNRKFVDCSNEFCYGGGYDVQKLIGGLYRERKTEGDDLKKCLGSEGSPKGRRRTGPCMHIFHATAQLTYREDQPSPLPG